jgi:hypothetical protein
MPDNPSLMQQLANRAKTFHANTGIPQNLIAKACGLEDGNYSAFLSGKRGIGAESTCLLLKYLAMPKREAIAKFIKPIATSRIMLLQEKGTRMQLGNDGYVPGQSGVDPDGTGDITEVPDAASQNGYDQATEDLLRQVRGYHRKAASLISDFIIKAKANRDGTTPPTAQKFFVDSPERSPSQIWSRTSKPVRPES